MPLRPSEHLRKHGLLIAVIGGGMLVCLEGFIPDIGDRGAAASAVVTGGSALGFAALCLGGVAVVWNWFDPVKTPTGPICRKCGYDLRASPGRCPECGTAVEQDAG